MKIILSILGIIATGLILFGASAFVLWLFLEYSNEKEIQNIKRHGNN